MGMIWYRSVLGVAFTHSQYAFYPYLTHTQYFSHTSPNLHWRRTEGAPRPYWNRTEAAPAPVWVQCTLSSSAVLLRQFCGERPQNGCRTTVNQMQKYKNDAEHSTRPPLTFNLLPFTFHRLSPYTAPVWTRYGLGVDSVWSR